jgi:hypothetical protein
MKAEYFRFDFKGKEKSRDNTFLTIRHESPQKGDVTLGISNQEDIEKRKDALEGLFQLSESIGRKSRIYHWNYHGAIMVETRGFDAGIGIIMSSNLEKKGVVPNGSTRRLRLKLKDKGHELLEDNISLLKQFGYNEDMELQGDEPGRTKEKRGKALLRLFRLRKRGRER